MDPRQEVGISNSFSTTRRLQDEGICWRFASFSPASAVGSFVRCKIPSLFWIRRSHSIEFKVTVTKTVVDAVPAETYQVYFLQTHQPSSCIEVSRKREGRLADRTTPMSRF